MEKLNLFEVVRQYGNDEGGVLSFMVSTAHVMFNYDDVTRPSNGSQKTQIGTFYLYDNVKFTYIGESEWFFNFEDCNNLGYKLSIRK